MTAAKCCIAREDRDARPYSAAPGWTGTGARNDSRPMAAAGNPLADPPEIARRGCRSLRCCSAPSSRRASAPAAARLERRDHAGRRALSGARSFADGAEIAAMARPAAATGSSSCACTATARRAHLRLTVETPGLRDAGDRRGRTRAAAFRRAPAAARLGHGVPARAEAPTPAAAARHARARSGLRRRSRAMLDGARASARRCALLRARRRAIASISAGFSPRM